MCNDAARAAMGAHGPGGETTTDHANRVGTFNVRTRCIGMTNNGSWKMSDQIKLVTRGAAPIVHYSEPQPSGGRRPFTAKRYTTRERPFSRAAGNPYQQHPGSQNLSSQQVPSTLTPTPPFSHSLVLYPVASLSSEVIRTHSLGQHRW